MNILPLVLALTLLLSFLSIQHLENLKNQTIVHKEYQTFLDKNERKVFNERQDYLYGQDFKKNIRQLSFRYFFDKKAREDSPEIAKQYRLLIIELMKIVYGEAAFYKELEQKRPHFLEELLDTIEKCTEDTHEKLIKRIEDLSRLSLEDSELQKAFYHMLKGTVNRKELSHEMKEKAYVSLFAYINDYGAGGKSPSIEIQHTPREILKAIFVNDEVVNSILIRRNELRKSPDASATFKNEFKDKRRPGISESLLDFKITNTDKSEYD